MSSDESLLTQIGILHEAFKNIQLRHPNNDSNTGAQTEEDQEIDLSNQISTTKIGNGTVTDTEFQTLAGVTDPIQTQLDGKQASGTYLTTVPVNTGASKIANGTVSNTEFQFLSGVTGAIQTQINDRVTDADLTTALSPIEGKIDNTQSDISGHINTMAPYAHISTPPAGVFTNSSGATTNNLELSADVDMNEGTPLGTDPLPSYNWDGTGDGTYLVKDAAVGGNFGPTLKFKCAKAGWFNISCIIYADSPNAQNRAMIFGWIEKLRQDEADATQYNVMFKHFLCTNYFKGDTATQRKAAICGEVSIYLSKDDFFRVRTDLLYTLIASATLKATADESRIYCQYMFP